MDRLLQVRNTAAVLILLAILSLGLCNIVYNYPALEETVLTLLYADMTAEEKISTLERQIDEEFFGKNYFIEGYGLAQLALSKDEMDDFNIVKDTNDQLHYTYFQTEDADVSTIGDSMVALVELAEGTGAECFYLMPMSKIAQEGTTFQLGVPIPDKNEAADAFLSYIQGAGVSTLDLRTLIEDSGIAVEDRFYDTAHLWTTQTAFWAFTQTVDYLEGSYGLSLDPTDFYTDINNYNQITYEASYLGSMGRTVGAIYGGIDDFTLIYPKFTTSYSHYARNGEEEKIDLSEMTFKQSLLSTRMFNQEMDIMDSESDKYYTYLCGNYGYTHIVNHNMEEGAKVLFIKDSFSVPLAAFLSTTCAEVDLIDPSLFDESVEAYVENGDYDIVIVSISPSNLIEDFFPF